MARIDYDSAAAGYARARALPLEAMPALREAIARRMPAGGSVRVADVGSGAGTFAHAFAAWFGARVVGVEPSEGMLAQALQSPTPAGASYVRGDAMALPLRDGSCHVAWLSTVIHHFRDLDLGAREVRRILRDDGVAFVRSSFPGRHDGITLFRRFPEASRVASSFPSVERTETAFAAAGLHLESIEGVPQESAPSLRAFLDRVRLRSDTTLRLMPDDAYEAGVEALERDLAEQGDPGPVMDLIDLLVFRP
jgi:ubiquinone/menaquinone biosynthesis C-methylase UbiE